MDAGEHGDPFLWDVDRLEHELCVEQRVWDKSPQQKLPDLAMLSESLRKHELDGQTLLTYEAQEGSREAFESLCKDLGIWKLPHKASLRGVIQRLQRRSAEYRRWNKKHASQLQDVSDDELPDEGTKQKRGVPAIISMAPLEPRRQLQHVTEDEPPKEGKKRKRAAPILISMAPRIAYLGRRCLTAASMRGEDSDIDSDYENWATPRPFPPGRRLQVSRMVRRLLAPKAPRLNLGRARRPRPESRPSTENGDDDVLLPVFGMSDSDNDYDEDTDSEVQEEYKGKSAKGRIEVLTPDEVLTTDEIDAIIDEEIRKMQDKWMRKNLSKTQQEAYSLWHKSRRDGQRHQLIGETQKAIKKLGLRLAECRANVHRSTWAEEAAVRHQAESLRATVEDKTHKTLIAEALASREPPVEPPNLGARAKAPKKRKKIKVRIEGDDEVLTTDSESEPDDRLDDDAMDVDDRGLMSVAVTPQPEAFGNPNGMACDGDSSESDTVDLLPPLPATPTRDAHMDGAERSVPRTPAKPALYDIDRIVNKGLQYWENLEDAPRVMATMVAKMDPGCLDLVRQYSRIMPPDRLWEEFCHRAVRKSASPERNGPKSTMDRAALAFTRLFDAFATCHASLAGDSTPLDQETAERVKSNKSRMPAFCAILSSILSSMEKHLSNPHPAPRSATQPQTRAETEEPDDTSPDTSPWEESDSDIDIDIDIGTDSDTDSGTDSDTASIASSKKGKRRIVRDKAAQNLRDDVHARVKADETRAKALRAKLAISGEISSNRSRLIINESKQETQGLIYINDFISRLIKDHQIDGVRFMWNQVVAGQGCLLAHTMGLGKTMQVITLLVAIAEASNSGDESIYSQIPPDLRESKTLAVCPAGLVDNWFDELVAWTASDSVKNLLGKFYRLDADVEQDDRLGVVDQWASEGGVLIVGYPMFRQLMLNDTLCPLLQDAANIVIADEAHTLKNERSQINEATRGFRTAVRIAMTGSPLSNSVEEYHSMINWISPNFLAGHKEFVQVYARPIIDGFYGDSTPQQKRRALTVLKALKDTVAPKIHRATVSVLKNELPAKAEFILYLPLTEVQVEAYTVFLQESSGHLAELNRNVQLWTSLVNLTLILAHPKVFLKKLKRWKGELATAQSEKKRTQMMFENDGIAKLLSVVQQADVQSFSLSYKILVLTAILDEAKKVGDKVLVFSQSRLVLDYLEEVCQRQNRRYRRLDGSTKMRERQNMVKNFNSGLDEVYLISTTAGGVGLNLHGANRVVVFDFKWNPMNEQQAIGRAYRIGQMKPVFVYWLIVGGTFETCLHDQAVFKTQLASRVVDKKNPQRWSRNLRYYTRPPTVMPQETVDHFRGRDVVLDAILDALPAGSIRRILSTDTFETEDPDDKLSAEELREAADMTILNKLRTENPQEYERRLAEKMRAACQPAAPGTGLAPFRPFTTPRPFITTTPLTGPAPVTGPPDSTDYPLFVPPNFIIPSQRTSSYMMPARVPSSVSQTATPPQVQEPYQRMGNRTSAWPTVAENLPPSSAPKADRALPQQSWGQLWSMNGPVRPSDGPLGADNPLLPVLMPATSRIAAIQHPASESLVQQGLPSGLRPLELVSQELAGSSYAQTPPTQQPAKPLPAREISEAPVTPDRAAHDLATWGQTARSPDTQNPQGTPRSFRSKLLNMARVLRLYDDDGQLQRDVLKITDDTINALETHGINHLPLLSQWGLLEEMVTGCNGFVDSVLQGHIRPERLATGKRADLLADMQPKQEGDPHHLEAHMQRLAENPLASGDGKWTEDLEEMLAVAERRKQRSTDRKKGKAKEKSNGRKFTPRENMPESALRAEQRRLQRQATPVLAPPDDAPPPRQTGASQDDPFVLSD